MMGITDLRGYWVEGGGGFEARKVAMYHNTAFFNIYIYIRMAQLEPEKGEGFLRPYTSL